MRLQKVAEVCKRGMNLKTTKALVKSLGIFLTQGLGKSLRPNLKLPNRPCPLWTVARPGLRACSLAKGDPCSQGQGGETAAVKQAPLRSSGCGGRKGGLPIWRSGKTLWKVTVTERCPGVT